jgi:hypothetical protein
MRKRLLLPALLCVLATTGCPLGPFPGGRLGGEVRATALDDWTFVEEEQNCQLETNPDDPYSVNTWCVEWKGSLYVPTSMILGPKDPGERQWVENVHSDPDVRVRVGGIVYELEAEQVADDEVYDAVLAALEEKYGLDPDERDPEREIWIFLMRPRE